MGSTTTTFAEHVGRTWIAVRWAPLNPTDAQRQTFDGARDGTFDQLTDYLSTA